MSSGDGPSACRVRMEIAVGEFERFLVAGKGVSAVTRQCYVRHVTTFLIEVARLRPDQWRRARTRAHRHRPRPRLRRRHAAAGHLQRRGRRVAGRQRRDHPAPLTTRVRRDERTLDTAARAPHTYCARQQRRVFR